MTKDELFSMLVGEVLEEEIELSMTELCRTCSLSSERVVELVEAGVIEPLGDDRSEWRFRGVTIRRVRRALRLERDLGVNAAGAALALDLLEELERLRVRLRRLEGDV